MEDSRESAVNEIDIYRALRLGPLTTTNIPPNNNFQRPYLSMTRLSVNEIDIYRALRLGLLTTTNIPPNNNLQRRYLSMTSLSRMTHVSPLSCLADASALILSNADSTTRKRKGLDDSSSDQQAKTKQCKHVLFCPGDTIIQSPLASSESELLVPTLWWSGEEIRQNLRQNMQLLSHELKHRGGDHIKAAIHLYQESSKETQSNGSIISSTDSCKTLLDQSICGSDLRGLERHHPIFKLMMTENRAKHAKSILKLQKNLVNIKHEFKDRMLRSLSAKSSRKSRVMARIMAQYDSTQVVSIVRQDLEGLVSGPQNKR